VGSEYKILHYLPIIMVMAARNINGIIDITVWEKIKIANKKGGNTP
tara:strand:+ start:686 stop:823 length:138 start_codon:yes stop_codon:yes gene_type:complete